MKIKIYDSPLRDLGGSVALVYKNIMEDSYSIPPVAGVYLWILYDYEGSIPENYKDVWYVHDKLVAKRNILGVEDIESILRYGQRNKEINFSLIGSLYTFPRYVLNAQKNSDEIVVIHTTPFAFKDACNFYDLLRNLAKEEIEHIACYAYYLNKYGDLTSLKESMKDIMDKIYTLRDKTPLVNILEFKFLSKNP